MSDADPKTVEEAHIAELTRQRDALLTKVGLLSAIVREVPNMIVAARMDERHGKQTHYDYNRAHRALHAPEK